MKNWFGNKLEQLQQSSPQVKVRWIISLTIVAALIVIPIWILSIKDLIDLDSPSSALIVEAEDLEPGVFYKLRKRTAQTFLYFQGKFQEENEISFDLLPTILSEE